MALSGRFHHMDIYVTDLERSVAFWGPLLDALGWSVKVTRPTVRSWQGAGAEQIGRASCRERVYSSV